MARALITGIAGFTGHYVQHELVAAGHEVWGLTHPGSPTSERIVACDLCDSKAMQRVVLDIQPELVVHLAGIAFVAHGDVDAIYRTNVVGAHNLLAALASLESTPRAVLMASSANVYGNSTAGIIDETIKPAPASDYAVSKLAMEHMASLWLTQLPITLVRPFNYTGIGQSADFLIPKIVTHLKQRASVIELGNIDVERDFSDVRMVAHAYRRLLEVQAARQTSGDIFNVCSGQGYTLRQVMAMGAEISGHRLQIQINPAFVRANEVKKLVGSNTALQRVIGPLSHTDFYATLRWMINTP